MIKNLTCIECPKGCRLTVETDETGRVVKVSGNQCPKGEGYGTAEVENPVRVLTSTVLAKGLSLKMIPVRTDGPIPRGRLFDAMAAIQKIRVRKPVASGEVIAENFLSLQVNLVATRTVPSGRDGFPCFKSFASLFKKR